MIETTGEPAPLSDKNVWIIDDDIPLEQGGFDDDDLLLGKRPIDRGTLRTLLNLDGWDDGYVRELCEQLANTAQTVLAFTQPEAAVGYLKSGAPIPDVVVYDLKYEKYRLTQEKVLEHLENILKRCVSVVQVYTKQSLEETDRELGDLQSRFHSRLAPPRTKDQTDAEELARVIADRLNSSLSAWLAKEIRQASMEALEEILVKIDDLPLDVAINMLAGKPELPEELELIELLSVKASEALETSTELNKVLAEYLTEKKVPADHVSGTVQEIVALLVSRVREHIQDDGNLFRIIQDAWQKQPEKGATGNNEETKQIVKKFFAFRVYSQPRDDIIRTGDIVSLQLNDTSVLEPPDLYLLITPACDLVRFWRKTRGSITLVKLYPIKDRGAMRAKSYGTKKFNRRDSITAGHPMVLPSIPFSEDKTIDYALFAYEIQTLDIENDELLNAGEGNKKTKSPLTYSDVQGKMTRKCRVSEPFLTGILTAIQGILFRFGIPDYPDDEKTRLPGLFNE